MLFSDIWEKEDIRNDWRRAISSRYQKRGDLSKCSNYRGISLLSVLGKIFNRVILSRLKNAVDPRLRDNQARFRRKRSCTDHIATPYEILFRNVKI